MNNCTPSSSGLPFRNGSSFATLGEALDYAATGDAGLNFYSGKGELLEALPYAQLRQQALQLARRMLGAGLKPGDHIAIIAENEGDFVRTFFACQYAGMVPAPLPLPAALGGKDHYLQHIRRMVESAAATAALAPAALENMLLEACAGLPLVVCGTLAKFDTIAPASGDLPPLKASDLAYLQFSSGSTRFPRGVAVTHRAVLANMGGIAAHGLQIGPTDRCISWLPLYHDMGLVGFLLTPLTCQISVDYLHTREFARRPLTWLQLISRNGGTLSYSPTFGYELCARRAEKTGPENLDLSRWRAAGIGGDMVRPEPLQKFADTFALSGFRAQAFVASYGMAEASLALSFAPLGQGIRADLIDTDRLEREHRAITPAAGAGRTREFVHCGRILPGHRLEVRDDFNRPLPDRRVGVIYVHGPSLMEAYFGHPEETAKILSADGWLNTGDLGYLTEGEVVITGRAKDLIILNGRNIWPQDLEWTAESEVSALRSGDVAAFAVDAGAGENVVVLFECRVADVGARDALRDAVAGVLRQRHGVEAVVVAVSPRALPQTSSGKLSRAKAKMLYLQGAFELKRAVAAS